MKNDWNPTENPAGSPEVELTARDSKWLRFEKLAKALAQVPKEEVDEKRREEKGEAKT